MNHLALLLFKIRKALYLGLEIIQARLLPPVKRTGKYFDAPLYTEDELLTTEKIRLKSSAYQEILRTNEEKGLFILGNARSGTTILMNIINGSDQVFLLGEANLFKTYDQHDFRGTFNLKHKQRRMLEKGNFITPPLLPEMNALVTLHRIGTNYKYCGEKTAFSMAPDHQKYLDFQAKYFLHSSYIYLVRHPVETIWSMHKMFPENAISDLILAWLKSLELIIECYSTFPKSYLVFFEAITPDLIPTLENLLKIRITFPEKYISKAEQYTKRMDKEWPEELLPYTNILQACEGFYQELQEVFSPETLRYENAEVPGQHFQKMRRRLERVIDLLKHFDSTSDQAAIELQAIQDPGFLIYVAGLSEEEVREYKILPDYAPEKIEDKYRMVLSEPGRLAKSNDEAQTDLRQWALESLLVYLLNQNMNTACRVVYDHLLTLDPRHEDANRFYTNDVRTAQILNDVEVLSAQKRLEEAMAILQEIHQKAALIPRVNYWIGFIHHQMGNFEQAIDFYSKAETLGFPEFWIYYNRGGALVRAGQPERAREDLLKAREINPDHFGVLSLLESL